MKDSKFYQRLTTQWESIQETSWFKQISTYNQSMKESSWYQHLRSRHESLKAHAWYRKLLPDTSNPKFYPILSCFIILGLVAWWTDDATPGNPADYAAYDLIGGGNAYQQTSLSSGNGMKRAEIIDRSGFKQPITASTILIPENWQVQGGVSWQMNPGKCGNNTPHTNWQAVSPDGFSAVAILPEQSWGGSTMGTISPQCPNVFLTNIQQYLQFWVSQFRSQARIVTFQPRPDIAQPLQHLARNSSMGMEQHRQWFEAGQVVIEYNMQGTMVEELIAKLVMFNQSGTQQMGYLMTVSFPGYSYRAPKGQLDLNYAEQIRRSIRSNPEYVRLKGQHSSAIGRTYLEGGKRIGEINHNANQDIARINQGGYENRNRIRNEGDQRFNEMMRETNQYVDPQSGNHYELSQHQKFHWLLEDGRVISTDDAFFLPYRDMGVQGRKLEQRR